MESYSSGAHASNRSQELLNAPHREKAWQKYMLTFMMTAQLAIASGTTVHPGSFIWQLRLLYACVFTP